MDDAHSADRQSLELSRRQQDRLPRNTKIEEALEEALQITAVQFAAHSGLDKHLDAALTLSGKPALALVSETDKLILPLPVRLLRSGHATSQPGFLLTLQDRAIAAWTEGTFKLRYFASTIPYSSVKAAKLQEVVGAYSGSVLVEADDTWTFNVPEMFENESIVQVMVNNFLGKDLTE